MCVRIENRERVHRQRWLWRFSLFPSFLNNSVRCSTLSFQKATEEIYIHYIKYIYNYVNVKYYYVLLSFSLFLYAPHFLFTSQKINAERYPEKISLGIKYSTVCCSIPFSKDNFNRTKRSHNWSQWGLIKAQSQPSKAFELPYHHHHQKYIHIFQLPFLSL